MDYDLQQIRILHTMMRSLANGKDPVSGNAFSDDIFLNHTLLKECFSETAEILGFLYYNFEVINNVNKGIKTNRKTNFIITNDERSEIPISKEPISISRFVYLINAKVCYDNMKKLQATQITKWLYEKGYLDIIKSKDGEQYKVPTEAGRLIGISTVKKKNSQGINYATNLYDDNAQQFILDNMINICFER